MTFPDPTLPTILLVDDCDDDIFLLRHRLRVGGITNPVTSCPSVESAWEHLAAVWLGERLPALLFVDIRMPGSSGFELIARIRAEPIFDEMKIVVATSSNHPADIERALQLGIDGYLIKLPPPEILAEFVREGPWFAVPKGENAARHALSA